VQSLLASWAPTPPPLKEFCGGTVSLFAQISHFTAPVDVFVYECKPMTEIQVDHLSEVPRLLEVHVFHLINSTSFI